MIIPHIKASEIDFIKNPLPFEIGSAGDVKRVMVIEGTASWCGPCRNAIPHLNAIQDKYKDKAVYVVAVSREDEAVVKKFAQTMKYTVVCDADEAIHTKIFNPLGMRGIPFAAIVDSDNKVVWHGHPMDPKFDQTLEKLAASASARSADTGAPAEKTALPLITLSSEELNKLSVKELKTILEDRKIPIAGAVEKADLVQLVQSQASRTTYYK